jgi:hypothetical protein
MPISLAGFTKLNSMTEIELTGLLLQLADRGVTGIKVYYEGGGDSGAIEEVRYTTRDLSRYDEEDSLDLIMDLAMYGNDQAPKLIDIASDLNSDISDFAEETILNDIEDWWNDAGGYGSLAIMVPSGKYKVQNTIHITNTEEYYHEGNLLSKA